MSYTLPNGDAADFSWSGASAYTAPAGDAADFAFAPDTTQATLLGTGLLGAPQSLVSPRLTAQLLGAGLLGVPQSSAVMTILVRLQGTGLLGVPQSQALVLEPEAGDEFWDDVILRLPFNTSLADVSSYEETATTNGTPTIVTSGQKYGAGCLDQTAATVDWVKYLDTEALDTGDYTIECWVKQNEDTSAAYVLLAVGGMVADSAATEGLLVFHYPMLGLVVGTPDGIAEVETGFYPTNDVWYYLTLIRSSGTIKAYIDGVLSGTPATGDTRNYSTGFALGRPQFIDDSYMFDGQIDDLRITKGVVRYTANFTPPTAALPVGPAVAPTATAQIQLPGLLGAPRLETTVRTVAMLRALGIMGAPQSTVNAGEGEVWIEGVGLLGVPSVLGETAARVIASDGMVLTTPALPFGVSFLNEGLLSLANVTSGVSEQSGSVTDSYNVFSTDTHPTLELSAQVAQPVSWLTTLQAIFPFMPSESISLTSDLTGTFYHTLRVAEMLRALAVVRSTSEQAAALIERLGYTDETFSVFVGRLAETLGVLGALNYSSLWTVRGIEGIQFPQTVTGVREMTASMREGITLAQALRTGFVFPSTQGVTITDAALTDPVNVLRAVDIVGLRETTTGLLELLGRLQTGLSSLSEVGFGLGAVAPETLTTSGAALFDFSIPLQASEQLIGREVLQGLQETTARTQDTVRVSGMSAAVLGLSLYETVTMAQTALMEYYITGRATETVMLVAGTSRTQELTKRLTELVTVSDVLGYGGQWNLADTLTSTLTATLDSAAALELLEGLKVDALSSGLVEITSRLLEQFRQLDRLGLIAGLNASAELLASASSLLANTRGLTATESLGLVERAAVISELIGLLRERPRLVEAVIAQLGVSVSDLTTFTDAALTDVINVLLAREPIALIARLSALTEQTGRAGDLIRVTDLPSLRIVFGLSETTTLTSPATLDVLRYLLAQERLTASTQVIGLVEILSRLNELSRFVESCGLRWLLTLRGDVVFQETLTQEALRLLQARQTLGISTEAAGLLEIASRVVEALTLRDLVERIHGLSSTEAASFISGVQVAASKFFTSSEGLALAEHLTSQILVVTSEQVSLHDGTTNLAELICSANTALVFISRMPLVDGNYQAVVINTESLGVTQYTNYLFNSLIALPKKELGLTEIGLYELVGTTDDSSPICTMVATGDINFETNIQKAVPRAYLRIDQSGEVMLRTITSHHGQTKEHWYRVNLRAEDVDGIERVRLRREIRSEFWSFELENVDGGNFELRGAEVLPVLLSRRS